MLSLSFSGAWKLLRSQFEFVENLVNMNTPISKHALTLGFIE